MQTVAVLATQQREEAATLQKIQIYTIGGMSNDHFIALSRVHGPSDTKFTIQLRPVGPGNQHGLAIRGPGTRTLQWQRAGRR